MNDALSTSRRSACNTFVAGLARASSIAAFPNAIGHRVVHDEDDADVVRLEVGDQIGLPQRPVMVQRLHRACRRQPVEVGDGRQRDRIQHANVVLEAVASIVDQQRRPLPDAGPADPLPELRHPGRPHPKLLARLHGAPSRLLDDRGERMCIGEPGDSAQNVIRSPMDSLANRCGAARCLPAPERGGGVGMDVTDAPLPSARRLAARPGSHFGRDVAEGKLSITTS
jgi:hypothetical protein